MLAMVGRNSLCRQRRSITSSAKPKKIMVQMDSTAQRNSENCIAAPKSDRTHGHRQQRAQLSVRFRTCPWGKSAGLDTAFSRNGNGMNRNKQIMKTPPAITPPGSGLRTSATAGSGEARMASNSKLGAQIARTLWSEDRWGPC